MTWRASADNIRDGNAIYVYQRLGHHLLFHRFLYDPAQPFVLVIAGGVFVAEAASVLLQTSWFKLKN